jgi:hypothetical protein
MAIADATVIHLARRYAGRFTYCRVLLVCESSWAGYLLAACFVFFPLVGFSNDY